MDPNCTLTWPLGSISDSQPLRAKASLEATRILVHRQLDGPHPLGLEAGQGVVDQEPPPGQDQDPLADAVHVVEQV